MFACFIHCTITEEKRKEEKTGKKVVSAKNILSFVILWWGRHRLWRNIHAGRWQGGFGKEKQTPPKRGLPAKCKVVQRCGTFQIRGAFFIEQGGFENGEVRLYIRYANKPFSKQRSYMENERGFLFVAQEFHIRRTILRHRIDNQFYQPAVMYIEAV